MADPNDKFSENVEGPFYVDENCISCGVCVAEAPDNFEFTNGEHHAYVFKQPENEDEKDLCLDAVEVCPVDAIGNDG